MLDEILKGPKIFKMSKAQALQITDDAVASIDKVLPGYMEKAERDRPDSFFRLAAKTLQEDRERFSECRSYVGDGPWEMSYEELARLKNEFSTKTPADQAEKAWDKKQTARGLSSLRAQMGPR